jgi:hypothetical protein
MASATARYCADVCTQDRDGFHACDDGSRRGLDQAVVWCWGPRHNRCRGRAGNGHPEVVERTIFSDGFGSDAEDIRTAMVTYLNTIGKIAPRPSPRPSSHIRPTPDFGRASGSSAQRPPHPSAGGSRSRKQRPYYGIRGAIEHSYLHRGWSRNDRECIEVVDVPALPITAMARAGAGRSGTRTYRADLRHCRSSG